VSAFIDFSYAADGSAPLFGITVLDPNRVAFGIKVVGVGAGTGAISAGGVDVGIAMGHYYVTING
jgi:hypothetical protein